jgi:hypothetical protein
MLKIKNDVNLKELEKFGFEYYEEMNEWFYYGFTKPSDTSEIRINIRNDNRNIHPSFDFNVNQDSIYDKIYDLIQAGLVEKIKE